MKARLFALLFVLACAPLLSQAPTAQTHASEIGFTYALPTSWEVVDTTLQLPSVKAEVGKTATSEAEKKGIACVQPVLTARHGDPASVVVVVALPFDCFGQTMTEQDLPGFASGAAEGLKNTFELSGQMQSTYSLGTHAMWVQRANGTLKSNTAMKYTVETVCSILKKGAVCWMAMAVDEAALSTFETGSVSLDGEAPNALVPGAVFDKKP